MKTKERETKEIVSDIVKLTQDHLNQEVSESFATYRLRIEEVKKARVKSKIRDHFAIIAYITKQVEWQIQKAVNYYTNTLEVGMRKALEEMEEAYRVNPSKKDAYRTC